MDKKTFEYIISMQNEWRIIYKQQQNKIKKEKGKAEKERFKINNELKIFEEWKNVILNK